ncbi:hypothetical protein TSUD_80770 [Trifolium subterraneum]|uniref:Uncharacterized protein n=1 Tax=Trifolium subterraneum TaxID=3900 RepID=A0A2Z6M918_TRISU|nr:hypothetical protein TSUD_80770 [Trifolium subterraneum]
MFTCVANASYYTLMISLSNGCCFGKACGSGDPKGARPLEEINGGEETAWEIKAGELATRGSGFCEGICFWERGQSSKGGKFALEPATRSKGREGDLAIKVLTGISEK